MTAPQKDIQIITALGGPSKVAELLSLPKKGGQQRVQNWLVRGIPAQIKVERPDLFMPEVFQRQEAPPVDQDGVKGRTTQGAAHV